MTRIFLLAFAFLGMPDIDAQEVSTVDHVEIGKYTGLWNEIYRIPNGFQDNSSKNRSICFNTTAEYALEQDNHLSVKNTCSRQEDGKIVPEIARAVGTVVDTSTNAKLTVNFTGMAVLRLFGIGNGDYWILGLGPTNKNNLYEWALVGEPGRKYGWILARQKSLPESETQKIFQIAESNGYTRSQFVSTQQPI